ncbi:trimethylguanosine synthase 1 [Cochliomyia hominivorax]
MKKMNPILIESKQPIFFSFNRILHNQEGGVDFKEVVEAFQEQFEKEQEENWKIFWIKQGEEIVLEKWNEKYKDYLKKEIEIEKKNDNPDQEKELEEPKLDSTTETDTLLVEKSWEDLWLEHREEIYCEQYLIFTTIFSNYYFDFKNSCETPKPIVEEPIEELEEQLKTLGLPTSFGGRPQNSGKRSKYLETVHYSDFYSDSEMENDEYNESDEEDCDKQLETQEDDNNVLHGVQQKIISKQEKRKRNRKLKNVPSFILEEKGLLKYWRKRFSLFSRFDEGIRLDRESWFSVTPEKVAKHLAERLKCNIIVDGFCGSGGNAIQFALTCDKVIAIDIDPLKLEMAKHNAQIYKVSHKIEFILGDFLQLAAGGKLKADIVFLSPPWGGPKYKNKKEFDIEKYLLPVKASELVEVSRNVSENIALFLPRNSNIRQIVKLAGVGNRCEIEHNYLDSRLVAITALYGEQILTKETTN